MTVHRYRTTAPMLIPAPARKPSFTSASVSTYSSPANPSTPQGAAYAATKVGIEIYKGHFKDVPNVSFCEWSPSTLPIEVILFFF